MKKVLLGVLAAFALTALGVPAYAGDDKKNEAAPAEKPDKKSPEARKSKKGGSGSTPTPK
ncbi:MAG TPA: hypothetical protein VFF06_00925 [Polyangia bacterium]|nr:hypothetical protein [Polyangia bacterium]